MTESAHGANAAKSVRKELTASGFLWIIAAAIGVVALYLLALWGARYFFDVGLEELGQFGDSFGGLTSLFNALAFAAVVVTVVLQVRELRESREQLVEQAKAQREWAIAATKQIELTKDLEFARSRPFITAGWSYQAMDYYSHSYSIRNVGLGVAILYAIELCLDGKSMVRFTSNQIEDAAEAWEEIVNSAWGRGADLHVAVWPSVFNDQDRVVSPGGEKELAKIKLSGSVDDVNQAIDAIKRRVEIIVHFESVYREKLSTAKQFDYLRADHIYRAIED